MTEIEILRKTKKGSKTLSKNYLYKQIISMQSDTKENEGNQRRENKKRRRKIPVLTCDRRRRLWKAAMNFHAYQRV